MRAWRRPDLQASCCYQWGIPSLPSPCADYLIGKLKGAEPPFGGGAVAAGKEAAGKPQQEAAEAEEEDPPALRKGQVLQAPLVEKEEITHDTRRFRFALPRPVRGRRRQAVARDPAVPAGLSAALH